MSCTISRCTSRASVQLAWPHIDPEFWTDYCGYHARPHLQGRGRPVRSRYIR